MISLKCALNRRRILKELLKEFAHDVEGLENCAIRLYESLPDKENLERNIVLVPYGGGKDSSYVVAAVRLIQLLIFREYQSTFVVRFVTNLQAGMAYGVLPNIDRVYTALGVYGDPLCEMLLVEGKQILPFQVDHKFSSAVLNENRTDVLVNGHLSGGSNRATFCNACNFSMVRSFALSLEYGEGADIVITGDSTREQRAYAVAVERMARDMGIDSQTDSSGFGRFLEKLDKISGKYNTSVHGDHEEVARRRIIQKSLVKSPKFFSLYDDLSYEAGHHWNLLVNYLGFEFHHLAFSFTESDCANPALMAHLRGLRAEHLWDGRSYHEGVLEYRDFALELMRRKSIPKKLIRIMEERYSDPDTINEVRSRVEVYARDVFGLEHDQLVCMIYSPFASFGGRLSDYLVQEKPDSVPDEATFHSILRGDCNSSTFVEQLENWSGLAIDKLRRIYASPLVDNFTPNSTGTHPISLMFAKDPHRDVISTRHSANGPEILEVESGR